MQSGGGKVLAGAVGGLSQLKEVYAAFNELDDDAGKALVHALTKPDRGGKLTRLDVNGNEFSKAGLSSIKKSIADDDVLGTVSDNEDGESDDDDDGDDEEEEADFAAGVAAASGSSGGGSGGGGVKVEGWGNLLDKFKPAPGAWKCVECRITMKKSDPKCLSCNKVKEGNSEIVVPDDGSVEDVPAAAAAPPCSAC
jgi:hypothetical protein